MHLIYAHNSFECYINKFCRNRENIFVFVALQKTLQLVKWKETLFLFFSFLRKNVMCVKRFRYVTEKSKQVNNERHCIEYQ